MKLVAYTPTLNNEFVNFNKLDITKLAKDNLDLEAKSFNYLSIGISSAITAYGRIYLNKLLIEAINNGGNIYYTDTDSLITDKELPKDRVNNLLGGLKLEAVIKKGIFISGKTYCYIDSENNFVTKAKGVSNINLSYESYLCYYLIRILKLRN